MPQNAPISRLFYLSTCCNYCDSQDHSHQYGCLLCLSRTAQQPTLPGQASRRRWLSGSTRCSRCCQIRVVTDPAEKVALFDKFMIKYAGASWGREEHTYPRLDPTAVYEVEIEKLTGKFQQEGVTLRRWAEAEGKVGGSGTYGCPFMAAAQAASQSEA
jgi:hypothetical protein